MIGQLINVFSKDKQMKMIRKRVMNINPDKPLKGYHILFLKDILVRYDEINDAITEDDYYYALFDLYSICVTELFIYNLYDKTIEDEIINQVGDLLDKRYDRKDEDIKTFYNKEFRRYPHSFKSFNVKIYNIKGTISVLLAMATELGIENDIITFKE